MSCVVTSWGMGIDDSTCEVTEVVRQGREEVTGLPLSCESASHSLLEAVLRFRVGLGELLAEATGEWCSEEGSWLFRGRGWERGAEGSSKNLPSPGGRGINSRASVFLVALEKKALLKVQNRKTKNFF